jgi:RHS repeat-associated protein
MIVRHGGLTNSQAMAYDAENRLKIFSVAGKIVVEYGYAAYGARLWKRIDQSATNVQVWIGNNYEEKGGRTLFHVYAGDQLVCTFETNSALFGGSDTNRIAYYYHEDNLNSSSALSGSGGTQLEVNAYYPFGRTLTANPQANFQVSRRFTGQVLDVETGLYYYNARYYDPELGRFIQPDTIIPDFSNPQSYNRYSYVLNNPLRYNDPSGHSLKDYIVGMLGLSEVAAKWDRDAWAKNVGNRGGNLGFKSFAEAREYVEQRKETSPGLNDDVRFAKERGRDISAGSQAAAGMTKAYIAVQASIVAPETRAITPGTASAENIGVAATRTETSVAEGTKVYRVWGDKAGPWGESWTTVNPNTVGNFRSAAGLPDANSGRFVSEGILQSTEGVTSRGALVIKPGQQGNLPELVIKNAEQKVKLQRVSGANPEF